MQINWKVRAKNPVFWATLLAAIAAPMLTAAGIQWSDVTSWNILIDTVVAAMANPAVVVAVIVAAFGIINDPTTAGITDSQQALAYGTPRVDGKHVKLDYIDNEDEM